jgi:hypothetical protein
MIIRNSRDEVPRESSEEGTSAQEQELFYEHFADDGANAGRTLAHADHADMLLSAHLLAVRPNDSHRNRPHGRGGFVVARRSTKMKEPLMIRSTHVLLVDRVLTTSGTLV